MYFQLIRDTSLISRCFPTFDTVFFSFLFAFLNPLCGIFVQIFANATETRNHTNNNKIHNFMTIIYPNLNQLAV